jgi:hypothetical protein
MSRTRFRLRRPDRSTARALAWVAAWLALWPVLGPWFGASAVLTAAVAARVVPPLLRRALPPDRNVAWAMLTYAGAAVALGVATNSGPRSWWLLSLVAAQFAVGLALAAAEPRPPRRAPPAARPVTPPSGGT